MRSLEVSGAVRHTYIYIYVIRRLKVNITSHPTYKGSVVSFAQQNPVGYVSLFCTMRTKRTTHLNLDLIIIMTPGCKGENIVQIFLWLPFSASTLAKGQWSASRPGPFNPVSHRI
jgi:hypothetical protein